MKLQPMELVSRSSNSCSESIGLVDANLRETRNANPIVPIHNAADRDSNEDVMCFVRGKEYEDVSDLVITGKARDTALVNV